VDSGLTKYRSALDKLFARTGSTVRFGLDRTKSLLSLLGNPHERVRSFHVAGTNGKGSVVAMLDTLLRAKGISVGRYTSPHLVDFRERIVVNGEEIGEQEILDFIARWETDFERLGATFFEITTALALEHFASRKVDVAVIETEMVDTARWISTHTEQEALIAAHDIGAVGYFGGRDILDLAGLADAEVIPILRDEAALADLLNRRGADYLMTFPGWYPMLTACAPQLHASQGRFAPALGGENMRVYRWPASPVAAPEGCMLYSPWPSGTSFAHERDLDPDRR